MAFVFRSSKEIQLSSPETNDIGPGQYLEQDIIKPSKVKSKAPFNINTYRNNKIKKDDFPGPGSYEYDDKFLKFDKIIQTSNQKKNSDYYMKSSEKNNSQLGSMCEFILEEKKISGFGSKDKRFKINKPNYDVPGPGYYASLESLRPKLSSTSPEQKSSPLKLKNSSNKINTIPSKNLCYGYYINENGILSINEDPFKKIRYQGIKSDSVGPGSYNLDKPETWLKKSIDWSKCSNVNKSYDNTTMVSSRNELVENSNDISSNYKKNVDKLNLQNSKEKLFRKITDRRKNLLNITNKNAEGSLVEKIIFGETPGPGYYEANENKFNLKTKPEKFQLFGSCSPRFPIERFGSSMNNEMGPGYYFKDDNKIEKKQKEFLKNEKRLNFYKRRDNLSQSTVEKNRVEKEEFNKHMGPGLYDPNSNRKKSPSNISYFGSLEKRFVINQKNKENSPGPGSYIVQSEWKPDRPLELHKQSIRKYDKREDPHDMNQVIENPPVGSYNPDIALSLAYKVGKKSNNIYQSRVAPFTSMEKRFSEDKSNSLGPGQYFKEFKVNNKQVFPPFSVGECRIKDDIKTRQLPGPSDYNKSSYFDWNKKSFNILYL